MQVTNALGASNHTQDAQKTASAIAALEFIDVRETLGVGTGSTVNALIAAMAQKKHLPRAAVSSSNASTEKLKALGIEVLDLNQAGPINTYIDGADECDAHFRLIKGGGGALTREKIIAQAARSFVCLIDESKRVDILGRFPLPIEVIPMARSLVARELVILGATPSWRQVSEGQPLVTDNGQWILDAAELRIVDPIALEARLEMLPGVVCVGLFARRGADVVICNGTTLRKGG
jgi:ribose 5-phosphate isomerase A